MSEIYRPIKEILEDRDYWRDLALKRGRIIKELEEELSKDD